MWSIACSNHVYANNTNFYVSDLQRVPEGSGLRVRDAVEAFVLEGARIWQVDALGWPENAPCAY